MKKLIISILFAISIILTTPNIGSTFDLSIRYALRWENHLIQPGDYSCIILQKCGRPIQKDIFPQIEHWLYKKNDGFYYILIFKEGVLTKIKGVRQ